MISSLTFAKALLGRSTTAALVVAVPAICDAQSFNMPGRVMRESTVPSRQTPLPITPAAPTPKRFNTDIWGPSFKIQVERCWKKPDNAAREGSEAIFRLRLRRDGTVEALHPIDDDDITAYGRAYQARALRAIMDCQPYDLPQAAYDEWRLFEPVFTERRR